CCPRWTASRCHQRPRRSARAVWLRDCAPGAARPVRRGTPDSSQAKQGQAYARGQAAALPADPTRAPLGSLPGATGRRSVRPLRHGPRVRAPPCAAAAGRAGQPAHWARGARTHAARPEYKAGPALTLDEASPRGRGGFSLPFSPMPATLGDTEARQRALYAAVAHEYDDVFPRHVAEHYIDKRTSLIKRLLPLGGTVLDVGCGTGQLGAAIASEGYDVFGVDLSAAMVGKARERGLSGTYAAVTTALPFADDSFDLALTVATLHHLETPERVATTVSEMGRVVKRGGSVVLWDHNPANP